jgi:hypothetical protein
MDGLPPEILSQILNYLSFAESARLLRVSRRWFQHLSPRVWRSSEDHLLFRIAPHRLQIYSSLIQDLTILTRDQQEHEVVRCPDFSQLTSLNFELYDSPVCNDPPLSTPWLRRYLAPSITSVDLDNTADTALLDAFANDCPQLRYVRLDLRATRLVEDPDAVIRFLQLCPSLLHISLLGPIANPRILCGLAMKPNLKQLDIHHLHDPEIVDSADLKSIPEPFAFSSLDRLVLGADVAPHVILKLLSLVKNVQHLCIRVPRSLRAIPISITVRKNSGTITTSTFTLRDLPSYLPNLRTLHMKFNFGTKIHPTELLFLASLTNLEELHLTTMLPSFHIPEDPTDTIFPSLFSGLGMLRELSLYCTRENLKTKFLIALGKSCRFLAVCTIKYLPLDISAFGELAVTETPLFPELTDLSVNYIVPPPPPPPPPPQLQHLSHQSERRLGQSSHEVEPVAKPEPQSLEPDPLVVANQVALFTTHFPKTSYLGFWGADNMEVLDAERTFTKAFRTAWVQGRRRRGERVRFERKRKMEYETVRPV